MRYIQLPIRTRPTERCTFLCIVYNPLSYTRHAPRLLIPQFPRSPRFHPPSRRQYVHTVISGCFPLTSVPPFIPSPLVDYHTRYYPYRSPYHHVDRPRSSCPCPIVCLSQKQLSRRTKCTCTGPRVTSRRDIPSPMRASSGTWQTQHLQSS